MIKLMLVDDHDLVRTGIRRLLDDTGDFDVVAEAMSGEDAIKKIRNCDPDVVLMDINMPGIGGVEATRMLLSHKPNLKIIVVSMHQDELHPQRILKAGALGYLTKGAKVEEIVHAIHEVIESRHYITPEIAQRLVVSQFEDEKGSPFDSLSERELQVLYHLMEGLKVTNISAKMRLSPKTISTYRYRLYDKLGVSTDIELARLALYHGLVDNTPPQKQP